MRQNTDELHFFIIWEHGRHKEKEILADIGGRFEILECFDIRWSPKLAISNFCRLDDLDWWAGRRQAKKRGTGRFLLITVKDSNPVYELAEAFHGFEWTNINVLELTKRFSEWNTRKDAEIVYSSIVSEDANRYLTLILGKSAADYLASVKAPWDGSIVKRDQDILGANGWNSLEEVFYVLNNTINYVVLRDFEELPHHFDAATHDIDILTDEPERLIRILNPPLRYGLFRQHGQVKVNIGGQQVLWDIRHTGDDYYCLQWEREMLQDKVLSSENVYVLNGEHHFYSFVYHILIHRKDMPVNWRKKTARLLEALSNAGTVDANTDWNETFLEILDYYFDLLNDYMKRQKYVFCQPQRGKYNHHVVRLPQIAERLRKRFGLSQIKPIFVPRYHWQKGRLREIFLALEDRAAFYRAWLNGKQILIKYGGPEGHVKNEFELAHHFHKVNKDKCYEVLFYSEVEHYRCIASEFIEGEQLGIKIRTGNFSSSERENVIIQLKSIKEALLETNILHCDIRQDNFFVARDGKLKLIDFGRAVNGKRHTKYPTFGITPFIVKTNSLFFRYACLKCARQKGAPCCDILALSRLLEQIGCQESYQETYRDVEAFLREYPEKLVVNCKYRNIFVELLSCLKRLFWLCFYTVWKFRRGN